VYSPVVIVCPQEWPLYSPAGDSGAAPAAENVLYRPVP